MIRRALVLATIVAACGVELGEPPTVASDEDGKGDGMGGGNGSGGGSGNQPMALTATGFLTKIATQYCDESFRCKASYPEGTMAFDEDFGTTTATCYAGAIAFYTPQLVEQSITAGRVTFNPGSAQLCLDGIVYQQSCAQFWQTDPVFPSACNTALLGTVAKGGACTNDFECANLSSLCDDTTKTCT
jgi:hypothetical protein